MSDYEYQIGDWVRVSGTVDLGYPGHHNNKHRLIQAHSCEPFEARIVGGTRRQEGEREQGYYEEPTTFRPTNSVFVWQVRRGLTNKLIDVLPEDLERIDREGRAPVRWTNPYPCDDLTREEMRKIANSAPRDDKGRFLPGSECEHNYVAHSRCQWCFKKMVTEDARVSETTTN